MTDEEIDKLSRASFPEADTSYEGKYWADMEAKLNKKTKRGFIFWWGAGVLLLFLSGGYFLNTSNYKTEELAVLKSETVKTDRVQSNETVAENSTQNELVTNDSEVSGEPLLQTKQEKENKIENTKKDSWNSKKGKKPEHKNETGKKETFIPSVSKSKKNPVAVNSKSNKPDDNKIMTGMASNSQPANNQIQGGDLLAMNMQEASDKESLSNFPKKSASADLEGQNNGINENTDTSIMGSSPQIIKENSESAETAAEPSTEQNEENAVEEEEEITRTEFDEPVESGKNFKLFVEPIFGIGGSQSTTSSVVETTNSKTLYTPSDINNWSIGIDFGVNYGSFFVKSGIRFEEINQNFTVNDFTTEITDEYQYKEKIEEDIITHENYVVLKIPDGNNGFNFVGNKSYTYDTIIRKTIDTSLVQTRTDVESESNFSYKIQYISVPLLLGYEYQIKEKWLVEVNTGLVFGFLLNQKGNAFSYSENEVVNLKESAYASKSTFSFSLGAGAGYYLKPDLSLRLRPSFNYFIKTPFEIPERQKVSLGVDLGLRFKF